jgi:hypothetical protein
MTDIIYMLVHIAIIGLIFALWPKAPDNVQRLFLGIAAVAMLVYLFGDILALHGVDNKRGGVQAFGISALWQVTSPAGALAHTALLVYFVRQWWIKTEICKEVKGMVR